jgi:hypothetical protein
MFVLSLDETMAGVWRNELPVAAWTVADVEASTVWPVTP